MATKGQHDRLSPDKALAFSNALNEAARPVIRRAQPRDLSRCMERSDHMSDAVQGMIQGMVPCYDLTPNIVSANSRDIAIVNRTEMSIGFRRAMLVVMPADDILARFSMKVSFFTGGDPMTVEFLTPYEHVQGKPAVISFYALHAMPSSMTCGQLCALTSSIYIASFGVFKIMPKRDGSVVSKTEFQLCLRCGGKKYFAPITAEISSRILVPKKFCSMCS